MKVFRSRAPVRISFAGGGTDVSPYPEERGGCVLSAAINKYSFTSLKTTDSKIIKMHSDDSRELVLKSLEDAVLDGHFDLAKTVLMDLKPESGMELFFRNDVPPRSGLGSSASGFVSMIGSLTSLLEKKVSKHEIAHLAYVLERERLKVKGGKQDQFASSYGGINFIEFSGKDVQVQPMNLSSATINELQKNLVLVFTKTRDSKGSDIIADQMRSYAQKKNEVTNALDSAKKIAIEMKKALQNYDLEQFGKLLHQGWIEKKKYSPLITTPFIDSLYETAQRAGAIGGKITGAGGGGYMVFYCYPDKEVFVRRELEKRGAKHIPFSFDFNGLETWSFG